MLKVQLSKSYILTVRSIKEVYVRSIIGETEEGKEAGLRGMEGLAGRWMME